MEIAQLIQHIERLGAAGGVVFAVLYFLERRRCETLQAQKDVLLEQTLKATLQTRNALRRFAELIGSREAPDDD